MLAEWTPMRWPSAWTDPSALSLLKGTAVNYLLIDKTPALDPVRAAAIQQGLHVDPSPAVHIVKGEWPGIRIARNSGSDATAGPTGVPWVDSNGWRVRLASALNPQSAIWVDAPPKENTIATADSYVMAISDAAAYGGRWIVSLDKSGSMEAWKRITAALDFFAAHKDSAQYVPKATVGVVSDFSGSNEALSRELLNLLARAGQHSRIILKGQATDASFQSLRALIYPDVVEPSPALRKEVIAFVEAGGLLITGPAWGMASSTAAPNQHPRFSLGALGKGKIAVANKAPNDPYMLANDASVLISHRYDLVRFWNSGAVGSYYTIAPGRTRAVVHLLFYADRGPDSASVRIAGPFRTAVLSTIDHPSPLSVKTKTGPGWIEVYLPPVSQYAALELGV